MAYKKILQILLPPLLLSGCFAMFPPPPPKPIRPFDVSRHPRAVVLTPMVPIDDPVTHDSVLVAIEKRIQTQFDSAGFRTVSPRTYEEIWSRVLHQVGGIFDPVTGAQVPAKYRAARRELFRELRGRFGAEMILYIDVDFPLAGLSNGIARWDGVTYRIPGTWRDRIFGTGPDGSVEALSLVISVETEKEGEIFEGRGGLALLEVIHANSWVRVDTLQLNPTSINNAVAVAIGSLLLSPSPADSSSTN